MTKHSTTITVNGVHDFWSPAARMAAAEARKRRATATAGRATGAAVRGKADAAKRIKVAAEAHGKVHGKEHAEAFQKAAHEHIARADQRSARLKRVGRKVAGQLLNSALGSYQKTGKL